METKSIERDKNGDVIFPDIPVGFWEQRHTERWTHVFHFKHDGDFFEVDYQKLSFPDMRQDLPKFDLVTHPIFSPPDLPASDEWIRWRNTYDYYLEKFFRPVLSSRLSDQGFPMKVDFFRLVLPRQILEKIKKFIQDCGLSAHQDFILYLIAKIEYIYVHDVEFYDTPEQRKTIRQFPKEIDRLATALKLAETNYSDKNVGKPKPELKQISFQFEEATIKITDSTLTSTIADSTRKYFTEGSGKDWEKHLRAFPDVYSENQMPNKFRYRICRALHNFFKTINAFDFQGKETTDSEVFAIAQMLDFAHVKFHNKKNQEFDIDIDKIDILKNVRHAIKRKELIYNPTHFSSEQIKPDIKKLCKYFDPEFIANGMNFYNEYDLRVVASIAERYGLNKLFPEMAHLYSCLKEWQFKIGHQFECNINPEIESNKDYQSWKTLIKNPTGNIRLKKMEFSVEGDAKTFELSEPLSMKIMENAINEYYKRHPFEFENDFYESKVELHLRGAFRLATSGKLHRPENRFFTKFCKQCYAFLLNEDPPKERDWKPSDRYLGCISQLLLRTFYFKHQMWDEEYILEQVNYWFNL